MAGDKSQTYNQDVCGYTRRLDRFMIEIHKSVGAGISALTQHDLVRTQSYLDAAKSYLDWVQAQPALDLRESHPVLMDLPQMPDLPEVENEDANDLIRLLKTGRHEIIHSVSSRAAVGLNVHDEGRQRAILAKAEAFLQGHVANTSPLDLSESSPGRPMSGDGRLGV